MPRRDSLPNIVLVSIDSLRADHCGFLGDDRGLTPALDALAADGVAFHAAVAPGPQTFSSMPATFTGYRRRTGDVPADDRSFWERRLAAIDAHMDRYGTLPERLRELGYHTAGFSPNPWTSSSSGFDRGFDRFVDLSASDGTGRLQRLGERLPGIDADGRALDLAESLVTGNSFFARWEGFYEELLAVRDALSEPYFLWVFALDTHYPFVAGRAHREETSLLRTYTSTVRSRAAMKGDASTMPDSALAALRRSYRDTVRSVDTFVSRLRADLAADDPALFVHADHGESLGEHGNYGHDHRSVYEENVHVPYLAHNVATTADVEAPVSLATLSDAVIETARTGTFDPHATTDEAVVATSECGTRRAVRGTRFKYVEHTPEADAANGDETADSGGDTHGRLFDLAADPGERRDVGADRPDRLVALRDRLDAVEGTTVETDLLARAAASATATETL